MGVNQEFSMACSRSLFLLLFSILLHCPTDIIALENDPPADKRQIKADIDSLLNLSWALARENPAESIALLEEIEGLHSRQDTAYKKDIVYYYYGVFYKNLNRFDESEANFVKYETYHEDRDNLWKIASVNMAKANLFSDKGDLVRSMEAVSKSLELYETLNDTMGIIRAGSKLGFLLSEVGRYEEAIARHRYSNALALMMGDAIEEDISHSNLGLVFEKQGKLDSAYAAHLRAYKVGEKHDQVYGKVLNRYNLASLLTKMGQTDAALPYLQECLALADSIDVPSSRDSATLLLIYIKLNMDDVDGAIQIIDSIAGGTDHQLALKNQMELYAYRAEGYSRKGNFEEAFYSHERFKALSDSLLGLESRNKVNEIEIQYESEKKQQQIALLDLENKTSHALIEQKDRTILIGGIGLVLISIFSIGLYVLFRKYLRQKNALSKALNDKDLLLREIHHRVKNNLQIVSSLLSLQGRSIDDETALQAINAGKSRVRSMALIHQSLYQRENLTGVNVQEYIGNLCNELFHTYDIDENKVVLDLQIDPLELDVDTLVPLGLIVNELITNALKYAFPNEQSGTLKVSLQRTDEALMLEVADNGVGYEETDVRANAFGRKLISSLVKQLRGELTTESKNGTHVRLQIHRFRSAAEGL